jgi:hypothetical protein
MTPPLTTMNRRSSFGWLGAFLSQALGVTGRAVESGSSTQAAEVVGEIYEVPAGPWGRISYYHFYLEAPDHLLEHVPIPSGENRWTVPAQQATRLEQMLTEVGLSGPLKMELLNPRRMLVSNGLYSLFPKIETLLTLTRSQRSALYAYLSQFPQNGYLANPVYFPSGSVDEWAEGTDLRPELIDLIKGLIYEEEGVPVFGDVPALLSLATSETEARWIIKKLSRVRSMIARLMVDAETDASQVLRYWSTGLGLRRKDIEPLLTASIMTKQVQMLDILHLLPPHPRKLLYTYPDLDMGMEGRFPDCHWSALNFFNYSARSMYLDEGIATSALREQFDKVEPPYQFGDVLIWMTERGTAIHACTYIAGDLVFTKNGRNVLTPWILSPLADVNSIYDNHREGKVRIQGMRKRAS